MSPVEEIVFWAAIVVVVVAAWKIVSILFDPDA